MSSTQLENVQIIFLLTILSDSHETNLTFSLNLHGVFEKSSDKITLINQVTNNLDLKITFMKSILIFTFYRFYKKPCRYQLISRQILQASHRFGMGIGEGMYDHFW